MDRNVGCSSLCWLPMLQNLQMFLRTCNNMCLNGGYWLFILLHLFFISYFVLWISLQELQWRLMDVHWQKWGRIFFWHYILYLQNAVIVNVVFRTLTLKKCVVDPCQLAGLSWLLTFLCCRQQWHYSETISSIL